MRRLRAARKRQKTKPNASCGTFTTSPHTTSCSASILYCCLTPLHTDGVKEGHKLHAPTKQRSMMLRHGKVAQHLVAEALDALASDLKQGVFRQCIDIPPCSGRIPTHGVQFLHVVLLHLAEFPTKSFLKQDSDGAAVCRLEKTIKQHGCTLHLPNLIYYRPLLWRYCDRVFRLLF